MRFRSFTRGGGTGGGGGGGGSGNAPLNSPAFTGNPTAPTPPPGDNDTSLATTAFVTIAANGAVSAAATSAAAIYAPFASPTLTGNPTSPTPSPGDNDTSIATTAFATAADTASAAATLASAASAAAALYAPIASPVFTGNPTAPTPTPGDNDTSIATTAFVVAAIGTVGGGAAPLNSPVFTGDPRAPTPTAGDNDTSLATTAFVTAAGVVNVAAAATAAAAIYAPLASPVLTGNPTAPTPTAGDSDTSIATTAFVMAALGGGPVGEFTATASAAQNSLTSAANTQVIFNTVQSGNAGAWYSTGTNRYTPPSGKFFLSVNVILSNPTGGNATYLLKIRKNGTDLQIASYALTTTFTQTASLSEYVDANGTDFFDVAVNPNVSGTAVAAGSWFSAFSLNSPGSGVGAPIASPIFTGDPRAPTPTAGDNDTSIATTAFVTAADVANLAAATAILAPKASPVFTGNPTGPTPPPGDNDTSLATTAFVTAAGTVEVAAAVSSAASAAAALYAPLASPVLTGNPTAPTASPGDNDTSIASTAFVTAADVVNLAAAATAAAAIYAPKASPVFTGNPTAPTPAVNDNDTSIATTAFVTAADAVAVAAAATAAAALYAPKTNAVLVTPALGAATATSVAADTFTTTANNAVIDATTARTFSNGDNGKTIVFTSASAIAATINTGLTAGWNCTLVAAGAGQITIGGTATKNNRNGLKSAGQNALLMIVYGGATDTYYVGGDTAP